ncbi:MAG: DUF4347 domain-containing protein, partial [Phycisphaeraceae bacterium]|nr:DUF4347 domain-containing protein [Phycisphaeraceae bacterium]
MGFLDWVTKSKKAKRVLSSGSSNTQLPCFEQLEPRVLLSADALMSPELLLVEPHYEAAIVVDLEVGSEISEHRSQLAETESPAGSEESKGQKTDECGLEASVLDTDSAGEKLSERLALGASDITASTLQLKTENSELKTDISLHTSNFTLQTSVLGPAQNRGPPTEIVFIDSSLNRDFELENAVQSGVVVSVFDADQDGIQHITGVLSSHTNLSAIHIISHGAPGQLFLGTTILDSNSIDQNTESLAIWGQALTAEGDMLLYGCSVGQGRLGSKFVQQLSTLTGADVAASDNPTGDVGLGGDWLLEKAFGVINSRSYAIYSFDGLLDAGDLDASFGTDGIVTVDFNGASDRARDVAMQDDGKIVVVGSSINGTPRDTAENYTSFVLRYHANGTIDNDFAVDGKASDTDSRANAVALQSDGKIVVGGLFWNGTHDEFAAWRYNVDGSPDLAFAGTGKVTTVVASSGNQVSSVLVQPDGKIVLGGYTQS